MPERSVGRSWGEKGRRSRLEGWGRSELAFWSQRVGSAEKGPWPHRGVSCGPLKASGTTWGSVDRSRVSSEWASAFSFCLILPTSSKTQAWNRREEEKNTLEKSRRNW